MLIAEEKLENIQELILQLQRLETELEDGFEVDYEGVSYVFCPHFIDRLVIVAVINVYQLCAG